MTKSANAVPPGTVTAREPRPFLFLDPVSVPVTEAALDPVGIAVLGACAGDHLAMLVRALVDHTIELQNRRALLTGRRQPIHLSVLNRRRRCARSWLNAILAGRIDETTCRNVATQWIPTLAASGPDLAHATRAGRSCIEFVRGALTALVFDEPAENLLAHARALHVLETVLGVHLAAVQSAWRRISSR